MNCPHCNSTADTWFDRSITYDSNGTPLEYEEFATRCSDCGRNVDAPSSYYNLPFKKKSFDIYLPATKCDEQGNPLDSEYIESIMIDVIDNGQHEFVTTESSEEIEACKIKAMVKRGLKRDWEAIKKLAEYKLERIYE